VKEVDWGLEVEGRGGKGRMECRREKSREYEGRAGWEVELWEYEVDKVVDEWWEECVGEGVVWR